MKRFFTIILAFFISTLVQASDQSAVELTDPVHRLHEQYQQIPLLQYFVSFSEHLQQQQQKARQQDPDQTLLSQGTDQFNWLSLFYLDQKDASLLSGSNGIGAWTKTPFGKARLVSCYSGIKDNPFLFVAVQTEAEDGKTFEKPEISPLQGASFQEQHQLYPVQNPLPDGETRTTLYEGLNFFPTIALLDNTHQDIVLNQTVLFKTYSSDPQNQEAPQPVSLSLPLKQSERYPTSVCAAMTSALQQTPRLVFKNEVTAKAIQNDKGLIQLVLTFQKKPQDLTIQIDNDFSFKILKQSILGKHAYLIIQPNQEIAPEIPLNLIVLSNVGWYRLPVLVETGSFIPETKDVSWFLLFKSGLLLFLFSPFFPFFLLQKPTDEASFVREIQKTRLIIIGTTFWVALLSSLGWLPLHSFTITPFVGWFILILLTILCFKPKQSLLICCLSFWFLPKPFLDSAFQMLPESGIIPFFTICLWGLCLLAPFNIIQTFNHSFYRFYQAIQADPKPVILLAKIPLILLFLWTFLSLFLPFFYTRQDPISKEQINLLSEQNKVVLVQTHHNLCLNCELNRILAVHTGAARQLLKDQNLVLSDIDTHDEQGKLFLDTFKIQNRATTLLFGKQKPFGLEVDTFITADKWPKYLKQIMEEETR